MITVLVCGGRNYTHKEHVYAHLDALHSEGGIRLIVHGCAKGADNLGAAWANTRGVPHTGRQFAPQWHIHLNDAAVVRNRDMAQFLLTQPAPVVMSFPGGRGTADMIRYARSVGLPVSVIGAHDWPTYASNMTESADR